MSNTHVLSGTHRGTLDGRPAMPVPGGDVYIWCVVTVHSGAHRDALITSLGEVLRRGNIPRPGQTLLHIIDPTYDSGSWRFRLMFYFDAWQPAAKWWQLGESNRRQTALEQELNKAMQGFVAELTRTSAEHGLGELSHNYELVITP